MRAVLNRTIERLVRERGRGGSRVVRTDEMAKATLRD
jgi:hypothetical protein